jgi:Holliday junction resolvase RusA-like endonuclease
MRDNPWFVYEVSDINPEPWTAPIGSKIRNNRTVFYQRNKLRNYKAALKKAFQRLYPNLPLQPGLLEVKFYFWRNNADSSGNLADGTNLLKSTEDALQGIIYANDRYNLSGSFGIVEQGPNVNPRIWICVRAHKEFVLPLALESFNMVEPWGKELFDIETGLTENDSWGEGDVNDF